MPRTRDATSTSRACLNPAATPMARKDGTRTKWRPGIKTQPKANAQNTPAALAARLNRPPGEGRVTVTTAGRAEAPNTVSDAGTSREPSPDSSAELTWLAHLPPSQARRLARRERAVREQPLGHEILLRCRLMSRTRSIALELTLESREGAPRRRGGPWWRCARHDERAIRHLTLMAQRDGRPASWPCRRRRRWPLQRSGFDPKGREYRLEASGHAGAQGRVRANAVNRDGHGDTPKGPGSR
jgi:hypothetical protein